MGDAADNDIKLFVNANGAIQVNAGTIFTTPATRANTTLIQIFGQGGNDRLVWSGSANLPAARVDGGAGNDTITSGTFNDTLVGGAGNDTYILDADSVAGRDTIDESGSGIDTLDFSPTTTRALNINIASTAAQALSPGLTVTLSAGNTIENVTGGALGDRISGNSLNNAIDGGGGNDSLTGAAGNDTYRFDADNALGSDTINESGGGADTIDFSATTTRAINVNLANAAAQVVNSGVTLTLGSASTIENVIGGSLSDTLTGNAANNVIEGRGGDDVLSGGAGNDTYRFDTDNVLGSDTVNESAVGGGIDTLDFSATTTRILDVQLTIHNFAQTINAGLKLNLTGGDVIENVIGGALGDAINGNSLNNVLAGSGGNDTITGGSGNDTLSGGAGDDFLQGGIGLDSLDGGTGNNILVE
jgi:Ca2+-binding RTX toxin-like protein